MDRARPELFRLGAMPARRWHDSCFIPISTIYQDPDNAPVMRQAPTDSPSESYRSRKESSLAARVCERSKLSWTPSNCESNRR